MMAPARLTCILLLALAGLTLTTYWPVTGCGFINFDDPLYVSANDQVRPGLNRESLTWAFTSRLGGNWHPLTWLSHLLDCQGFGLNPGRHHLVSLLFHTANAMLLMLFLVRSTGSHWRSAAVAALFALHPLHVESVAWIAERKDVLSVFFLLLTMLAYHRYARSRSWRSYGLVLLLLALGLMSKAMLVTAPLLLLLLDYWPLQRWQAGSKTVTRLLIVEKIPLFLLALLVAGITWRAQEQAGAMSALASVPFPVRFGNGLIACAQYLGQSGWPAKLILPYPYVTTLSLPQAGLAAGLLAALSFGVWRLARRQPYLLFAWLWFLTALLPVIGLIQVGVQARADRYTYLPHIGLFIGLVWGSARVCARRQWHWPLPAAAMIAILIGLGLATRHQLQYWRDSQQLFRHALAHSERNYTAHHYLGLALAGEGRLREAEEQYQSALRLQPNDSEVLTNLGVVLSKQGRYGEAHQALRQAADNQPGNSKILNNLGNVAKAEGDLEQAASYYRAALTREAGNREALFNLANTLEKRDQLEEAVKYYRTALSRYPDFAEAHNGLGVALAKRGELAEAGQSFQEALRLRPGYRQARDNLSWLGKEKP